MSMTHDEMIAVIQAHKDGKTIEYQNPDTDATDDWNRANTPIFNFARYDYRIAPNQKKQVKLLAWFTGIELCWFKDDIIPRAELLRVPSEDKVIEIED